MTKSIYDTSYVIYKHTNIVNGKSYIGQTIKGMEKRWNNHCSRSTESNHFRNAIQKYGKSNWTHEVLYVSFYIDVDHLNEVEISLIAEYDTFHNGYNGTEGGGNYIGDNNPLSYAKLGIEGMKAKSSKVSSTHIKLGISKGDNNNCSAKNMSKEKLSSKNSKSALTRNGKHYVIIDPDGNKYEVFGTKKNHLTKLMDNIGLTSYSLMNYINKGIVPTRSKPQNNSQFVDWQIYTT